MKKRILIVDDEQEMCWALEKPLSKAGYEVFTANDGNKGLQIFKEQPVNIILLDVKINKMSGLDILEQIRASNENVPVFIMTGYSTMDIAADAISRGANGFFTKPVKISKLLDTLKEQLY